MSVCHFDSAKIRNIFDITTKCQLNNVNHSDKMSDCQYVRMSYILISMRLNKVDPDSIQLPQPRSIQFLISMRLNHAAASFVVSSSTSATYKILTNIHELLTFINENNLVYSYILCTFALSKLNN